jgi:hypothetical protein
MYFSRVIFNNLWRNFWDQDLFYPNLEFQASQDLLIIKGFLIFSDLNFLLANNDKSGVRTSSIKIVLPSISPKFKFSYRARIMPFWAASHRALVYKYLRRDFFNVLATFSPRYQMFHHKKCFHTWPTSGFVLGE